MVILDRETGRFLGCAGLHELEAARPELGVWLKKSAHGNGFGREGEIVTSGDEFDAVNARKLCPVRFIR